MTQIEREELVERYLAGEMSQTQESDFFLHVAVDNELQRTLRAFRIMDRAIRNDSDVVVPERSRYRQNIMAMLAATPVAGGAVGAGLAGSAASHGAAATGASATGASAGASATGVSSAAGVSAVAGGSVAGTAASGGAIGALGLGAWKIAIITLVGGMLAAGTAFVVSSGNSAKEPTVAPAVTAPAPAPSMGVRPEDAVTGPARQEQATETPAATSEESQATTSAAPTAPRETRAARAGTLRQKEGSRPQANVDDRVRRGKKSPTITLPTENHTGKGAIELGKNK